MSIRSKLPWGVALAATALTLLMLGSTTTAVAAETVTPISGAYTETECGPAHPILADATTTTIDVVAAAVNSANDIYINLYDPSGNVVAHGDTATSPESVHYGVLVPGTYTAKVCPFNGGVLAPPYDYTGTAKTSDAPFVGVPGSQVSGGGVTPAPNRIGRSLTFAPATIVDLQRTEGEPLNSIRGGRYWESGPWGTSTQQSFIHRSDDNGKTFHVVSPAELRPDAPPGGGDTDVIEDDQGYVYFTDLEALVNLGTSVSNDGGKTWRKNPAAVQNVAVDRQWLAVDNGTSPGPADNTVFQAFHMSAVGTFVYSTPGSTGPTDAVGGLVWQNSAANAPLPVAADATCAQLRFDPLKRNLYYACNEGNHVRLSVGHVAVGQRTGIAYKNFVAPQSPGGGDVGHLFPALAVDKAGTVYVAWIDEKDNNVYYSFSVDEGRTFSIPAKVNEAPANTNEFLWAQAGAKGNLVLAWLGTEKVTPTGPDGMPSWKNDPNGATAYPWYGYVAAFNDANTTRPKISQQRFTEKPMHFGQICNQGIGCSASGGDRTMADYFGFSFDGDGAIRIVYDETSSQHHGAHLYERRQLSGPSALGGNVNAAAPANPMPDETGDAVWPRFPVDGTPQPQLDLTGVRVSQPDASTLQVRMSLASLASFAPPPGRASAVWLTRFQALSTGDAGEPTYRIFYVGAESLAGAPPTFFAGTATCTTTDPGNCKVLQYPVQTAATGEVCGNSLLVRVPLQGLGKPVQGDTLYSVTGFTLGRNDSVTDLYADVDATGSFNYTLGSAGADACSPASGGGGGGGGGGSAGDTSSGGGSTSSGGSTTTETAPSSSPPQEQAPPPAAAPEAPAASAPAAPPAAPAPAAPAAGVAGVTKTVVHAARGWGAIRARAGRGWFWFRAPAGGVVRLHYDDAKAKVHLRASGRLTIRIAGGRAVVSGRAKLNGKRTVRFTVTVLDRGRRDTFRIAIGTGYARSGAVVSGGLRVA